MTTANDILNKHFTADFAAFNKDLSNYQDLENQKSGVQKAYQTELAGINWKGKNPWLVFIAVMQLILDPGVAQVNNMVDQKGEESECQSALLKCQNDLQNITNDKGNGSQGVLAEARGMNKLISAFAPSTNTKEETPEEQVFGASGCADVSGNLLTIRHQIYVGKQYGADQANNPTAGYNSETGSFNYYFAVGASSANTTNGTVTTMDSYGTMHKNLSEQGDPGNAIEANTQLANAFNTNTAILQSVQQETKEELSQAVNTVKTLESAGSMMGHATSQVSSAAIQNMRGG